MNTQSYIAIGLLIVLAVAVYLFTKQQAGKDERPLLRRGDKAKWPKDFKTNQHK